MNELYILDGYGLIYRSYYAFQGRSLNNARGENISAIFAFYKSLFSIFKIYKPNQFLVALDSKGKTFRDDMYDQYKSNRQKAPEDLHTQTAIIELVLESLGLASCRVNGYEADDIIGTIAKKRADNKLTTYIISSDKDLMQLINNYTFMLRPQSKEGFKLYKEDTVVEDKLVKPSQIVDYLAIIGDNSDNIPGVAGLGPKAAEKLLKDYPSLEDIYQNIDKIEPNSYQKKLKEHKEMALLSYKLASLCYNVPLPTFTHDDLIISNLNYNLAKKVFLDNGLTNLASDCDKMGNTSNSDQSLFLNIKDVQTIAKKEHYKNPLSFEMPSNLVAYNESTQKYRLINSMPSFIEFIDELRQQEYFAFDTETTNLDYLKAHLVGLSFCYKENEAVYIPLKSHLLEKHLHIEEIKSYLELFFNDSKYKIIGQNIKYDIKVLAKYGLRFKPYFDTMLAGSMLDSESLANMDYLAERYLSYQTIKFDDIVNKKETFDSVPIDRATIYAAEDADITFKLYKKLDILLKEKNLNDVFYNLEMPLLSVLVDMELEGIKLNTSKIINLKNKWITDLTLLETTIYKIANKEFNIASPKQLGEVLFDHLSLKQVKKNSTDSSVLEELKKDHEIIPHIIEYRKLAKLISTYTENLVCTVDEHDKIHTDFAQLGAATGRLSSRNPNLQNIPIREENGRLIRSCFEAKDNHLLVSADYSQIELVVLAHLAGDEAMLDTFKNNRDLHRETASFIFNKSADEVTNHDRSIAKTINFGVLYGMSAFRLSNELEIPRSKAKDYIDNYFKKYHTVKTFMDKVISDAEVDGGVHTLWGRFRPLKGLYSANANERNSSERAAVNTIVQGSAADIVKQAMLNISNLLKEKKLASKILLQIHDEIILECPENELEDAKAILQQAMLSTTNRLSKEKQITLKVNIESGKTWGEFH